MTKTEKLAIDNDLEILKTHFNPEYIKIFVTPIKPGCIFCLKFKTVNVPTYVLTENNNTTPQYDTSIEFEMDILPNYPKTKPRVYYGNKKWLYHVNVFASDQHAQCTDKYDPKNSSMVELAEKTLRAIVFDKNRRFNSMASSIPENWQRSMEEKGKLPTMNPALLFMRNIKRTARSI